MTSAGSLGVDDSRGLPSVSVKMYDNELAATKSHQACESLVT
jgi:hypothetical protein